MKRTFKDVLKRASAPEDELALADWGLGDSELEWEELLRSRRILLVSEAGAGKTYECSQQARLLFEQGEAAFYLALERVALSGVASVLYGDHEQRFRQWLASSSQMAYFFLDSIDELQLVHGSFRDALGRLAHDLGGALVRATILVTSRPVAIDRRAFREVLPVPKTATETIDGKEFARIAMHGPKEEVRHPFPSFREVQLLPFTDEQIVEFSRSRGVTAPERLLAAIDARHARDFARRPQDLIELCDSWRDHGEIRAHFEQVKSHILARLAARPERRERADLTIERARQGAQRLALGVILCRRLTIRFSAGADLEDSGDAPIDPRVLLPDWSVLEIAALLERPIFGEGGYGRVRFVHRSVMEFLGACEIHHLVESGKISLSAALRLLCALAHTNATVLKPSMRPVAGWLALLRPDTFDVVLKLDPSTLLIQGDPESLTDIQRERALSAFVERYGKGSWRGLQVPDVQLARLAQEPLSDAILRAWRGGVENPEVRELLLRLIAAGRFRKCVDLAASVARDASADDHERFEALVALSTLRDGRLPAFVQSAVVLAPGWTERLARWIGIRLYPEHVSDVQLLHLLSSARVGPGGDGGYAASVARVIETADLSTDRLEALLPGLLALARSRVEMRDDQLGDREGHVEVSSILRALCIRLLDCGVSSGELLQASVLALRASESSIGRKGGNSALRALLNDLASDLRQQVFDADLACVALFTANRGVEYQYLRLVYEGALSYSPEKDWRWVLNALSQTGTTLDYRGVLLRLATHLASARSGDPSDFDAIRLVVADSSVLLEQLDAAVAATHPSEEILRMLEQQRQRTEQQQERAAGERSAWLAFWNRLIEQPASALAPEQLDATVWNLWLVLRKATPGGDDGRWDRAFLEAHFGHEVTNALRQGFMAYWRRMRPTLRRERKAGQKNTYAAHWLIGLVGIYAEAEDPDWAARLTIDEADLAARYALLELNGLPRWLTTLAEAHATTVARVVGDDLADELSEPPGKERWYSMLLQGLQNGQAEVARLLQPGLIAWLGKVGRKLLRLPHSEFAESKVDQVTRVLLTHGDSAVRQSLEKLASQQVRVARNSPFLFVWLPVLFRLNPSRGAAALLTILDASPEEQEGIAVRAIGSLFNERRVQGSIDWSSALPADLLLKLVIAIHRHVKPERDRVHQGVYSPGDRDYAENGRRYVFEALMQASGPEAMRAKLTLAAHPTFSYLKDRIAELAQQRLAAEVDTAFADMSDLAGLLEGRELPPKSGTDMAQLLNDRLDDLQELMLRDTGPRAAWASVTEESALRTAITHELEMMAKRAYTTDQEAVTADGKETDIRLRSVYGQQATIELKVGEKSRSARVLRDAIEHQLVKKYMAHRMAGTGCLLVTVADPKKRWLHPETNSLIDRLQLQQLLEAAAQTAQDRLGGDARVMARVLDLTPRLGTEAKAASAPVRRSTRRRAAQSRPTHSKARGAKGK